MPIVETHRILLEHIPGLRAHLQSQIPKRLAREIDAEDMLQEFVRKTLETQGSRGFDGVQNIRSYLYCAASSALLDKIREHGAQKRGGGRANLNVSDRESIADFLAQISGDGKSPSSEAAVHEAEHWMQRALLKLPDDQREAVQLCKLTGLSCEEAGRRMGRTRSAVSGLLRRGLQGLRVELRSPARFLSDVPTDAD